MSQLELTSDKISADQLIEFLLENGAETGDLDLSGSDITNVGNLDADNIRSGGVETSRDADVVFYVDQANGDDSNDGKSASAAFASYERALEELPRFPDGQVQIRQIGDYSTPTNTPLKITNRSGALYQDGEFSLEILGDSELGAVGDDDPASMERFDGNIHIEGVSGVNIKFLEFDGMPWVTSSIGVTFFSCYMYGAGYAFAYLRSGEVNLIYNIYDGQVNDPNIGFSCLRNGRMQVEGGEIRNWDYQNNVAYQAFNGGKIIDGFDDKSPDANRSGDIVPVDGRGISDEAFDRDLDGKDLIDGSNTIYDGTSGQVGATDTPIAAQSLDLPNGYSPAIEEDSGDLVINDSSGNAALRWDDANGEWKLGGDVDGSDNDLRNLNRVAAQELLHPTSVPSGETLVVPSGKGMVATQPFEVDGELSVDGQFKLL